MVTWKVCVAKTAHTIHMTDSDNDGWTSSSTVTLLTTKTIGSYRLSTGSVSSTVFPVLSPSSFDYSGSPFIISKDVSFSITPTYEGDTVSFTVSSGSLPTGLTLNPNTGVISGVPTVLTTNKAVTIKIANILGSMTSQIMFSVLANPSSCSDDKVLITLTRTTKGSNTQEVFTIHSGSTATSYNVVFTQPTLADNHAYTWTLCVDNTIHSLKMTDSNADGWST